MDLDHLLAEGRLKDVRKQGRSYLARCPAHEDRHPSLSIAEGRDGRILLHCWAGCATKDVLVALGLTWRDLYSEGGRGR